MRGKAYGFDCELVDLDHLDGLGMELAVNWQDDTQDFSSVRPGGRLK
jgi:hypothetical protein